MDKEKLIKMLKALLFSLEDPTYEYDTNVLTDSYDTVFKLFADNIWCNECPVSVQCVCEKAKSCETLIIEYLQERKYKDEQ